MVAAPSLGLQTCESWLSAIFGNQRLSQSGDRGQSALRERRQHVLHAHEGDREPEAGHAEWAITLLVHTQGTPRQDREVLGSSSFHFQ